ncbi:DUF1858 domain-containing protein [Natranaerobius trueperi]|uniref:Disulfide oxidoreductase n=1 Tax=Natranaerobius trueperi TaxID=759412 RepID=A0A226BWS0_9FIRM|nr:disulfide oxidoreductase [Natranaerobius trueperi]
MTISEVLKTDKKTAEVFMEHGMHCLGCPSATGETVEQAAMVHGADVDQLIEKLNKVIEE